MKDSTSKYTNDSKEKVEVYIKIAIKYKNMKKDILDVIVKYFGYYNGKALEKMSHYETPWINARKGLLPMENSNNIINKEDITEYFTKVKNKYNMINILDIKKYSTDQFKRVIEL